MGNQQVSGLFKEFRKKGEEKQMTLTAEALLLDTKDLIRPVFQAFAKNMHLDPSSSELKALFTKNVPELKFAEDESHDKLLAQKYLAELNELFAAGFKTTEAVIEDLQNPSHVKYFNVYYQDSTDNGSKDYNHNLMVSRGAILLMIYHLRQSSSDTAAQSFSEFLMKHLNSSDAEEASQQQLCAIPSSLGFVVTLLREMQGVPGCGPLLVKTLEHINFTLKRVEPGSFFRVHSRTSFILDASLNDARAFLVDIIKTQKDSKSPDYRVITLALKVLLTTSNVRKSVEDVLTVCSLLADPVIAKGNIDLREEIQKLREGQQPAEKKEDEEDAFEPINPQSLIDETSILELILYPKDRESDFYPDGRSWVVDGDVLYGVLEERKEIIKVAMARQGGMPGRIIRRNTEAFKDMDGFGEATLLLMNDKLYLRHAGIKPAPFCYVDKETLKVTAFTEEELEKQFPKPVEPEEKEGEEKPAPEPSLRWDPEPEEGGRSLSYTPMFSDGRYLYVIARVSPTKKEKEEAAEDEDVKTKLQCEIYDPEAGFKLKRSFILYKNQHQDPLVKEQNSSEYLKHTRWATNGEFLMMMSVDGKMRWFSMKSGTKIAKVHWLEDYRQTVYSVERNVFYSFKNLKVCTWSIDNLKKAQRQESAAADPLADVSAQFFKRNEKAQAVPNLIQQLMQGLTTQELSTRAEDQFVPIDKSMLAQSARLQRAILLQVVSSDVTDFEVHIKSLTAGAGKVQSKDKLKVFRYPLVTYLTAATFREIGQGLAAISDQFAKGGVEEVDAQCAIDFLRIASANFGGLTICQLSLADLFTNSKEYDAFMAAFNKFSDTFSAADKVKSKIKQGVNPALGESLAAVAGKVLGNAISLVHKSADDVLTRLEKRLSEDVKKCEEDYAHLMFVSQSSRLKALLGSEYNAQQNQNQNAADVAKTEKNRVSVIKVFQSVTKYLSQDLNATLGSQSLDKASEAEPTVDAKASAHTRAARTAAQNFVTNVVLEMFTHYADLCEQLSKRRKSQRHSAAVQLAKEQLDRFSKLLCEVAQASFTPVVEAMATAIRTVETFCEAKKAAGDNDEAWGEGVSDKYKAHSARLASDLREYDAFQQLVAVYSGSLSLMPLMDGALARTIVHGCTHLLQSLSKWYTLRKKFGERLGIGADSTGSYDHAYDETLEHIVDKLHNSMSWQLGHHAYGLVKVDRKEDKQEKEEGDDAKAAAKKRDRERKQALQNAMKSNLLSGGVDYDHLSILKPETKEQLQKYAALAEDSVLLGKLKGAAGENQFERIILAGKDQECDLTLNYLQKLMLKNRMKHPWATIGGDDGMRLSRAAFAVMIKFSDLADDFASFVDFVAVEHEGQADATPAERDAAVLKMMDDYLPIVELWKSAARMRQWINATKLEYNEKHSATLIAKLKTEKKEAHEKKKEAEAKADADKSAEEEKKPDGKEETKQEKPAAEEAQIDTSGDKKEGKAEEKQDEKKEDKKEADEKKKEDNSWQVLTEDEKAKCEDDAYALTQKDLQTAYEHLITKAVFLTKLNVPTSFKKAGAGAARRLSALTKNKSKRQEEVATEDINEAAGKVERKGTLDPAKQLSTLQAHSDSWETRLKRWKDYQRSQGTIVSMAERKAEIQKDGVASILALLQTTEVQAEKIQELTEKVLLDGAKRVAGLKLLRELTTGAMPRSHMFSGLAWFTTALRQGTNKLTHYLDDLNGQGLPQERVARQYFFDILGNVISRLKDAKEKEDALELIDALKWRYTASDHESLARIGLFAALHRGNGEWDNLIRRSWGKSTGGNLVRREPDQSVHDAAYAVFEMVFMLVTSRVTQTDQGDDLTLMKQASGGTKMLRRKSVVDESVSELLLGQAFDVIFRELDRYVKLLAAFDGLDWEAFARKRNEARRNDADLKPLTDEDQDKLFDEIEEELAKEEEKANEAIAEKVKEREEKEKEKKDAEEAEKKDEAAEGDKKDEEAKPEEEKKDGEKKEELDEEKKKELEEKRAAEEEKKKQEEEEARKKFDEGIVEDQVSRADQEIEKAKQLYKESQLLRILNLVQIFSSVAKKAPNALAMVQKVASPSSVAKLLSLLVGASPPVKTIVLKVIENLVSLQLPKEIFDEGVKLVAKDSRSLAARILKEETKIKFAGSSFLQFLTNYLMRVRGGLWSPNTIESEGQYAVTQVVTGAMRVLASIEGGPTSKTAWSWEIRQELGKALLSLETLSLIELDTMMCLLPGGEYEGVSAGDAAMTSKDQTVICLGFSSVWNTPEKLFRGKSDATDFSKVLSTVRLSPEFNAPDQKVVALFYDKDNKSRQELMLLNPASLSVMTHVDQDEAQQQARNSPLMDKEVLKKLVNNLGDDSTQKSRQTASLVLKILVTQIEAQGKEYLTFIKSVDDGAIFDKLLGYLQADLREAGQVSKKSNKSLDVLPQKWLEAKIQRIRKFATETTQSLDVDEVTQREVISTMLIENQKELVIKRENPRTREQLLTNVFVTSAINMHRVPVGHPYDSRSFASYKPSESGQALKSGLVAIKFSQFKTLTDDILEMVARSDAIIIGHQLEDDLRDAFQKLFQKVRDDFAKAAHQRKGLMAISDTAFFFVQEEDMPDFDAKTDFSKGRCLDTKELRTPLEHFLQLLEHWGGYSKDKALLHIDPSTVGDLNAVVEQIQNGDKEAQKKDEEYQAALKEAEANQKDKAPLKELQNKMKEKIADEVKVVMEKKIAIKGLLAAEELKKKDTKLEQDKLEPFTSFQDDKTWWKELETVGDKTICKKIEGEEKDDKKKQKSEEQMTKLLWSLLEKVGDQKAGNLGVDHDKAISSILSLQKKQCLLELINQSEEETIFPLMIGNPKSQRLFISFIKLQFNAAVLKQLQVGTNAELKQVKDLIRRAFAYSLKNKATCGNFIKNVFENGCLKPGIKCISEIRSAKASGVLDYFQVEDNALNGCNPYLLKFVVSYIVKHADKEEVCKELIQQKNALSNIFGINLCLVFLFQKDNIVKKLLKQVIKIMQYMAKNESVFFENGELARVAQNKLVKAASATMKWQLDEDVPFFSTQQVMFLEIHLAISKMCDRISSLHGISLGKVAEDSWEICVIKKVKQVLLESESFDLLKYVMHYEALDEKEQKFLNMKVEAPEPTLETSCRAYVNIPEVQKVTVKATESSIKLARFEYFGVSSRADGAGMSLKTASDTEFEWPSNCFYLFYPVVVQQAVGFGSPDQNIFGDNSASGDSIYKLINPPPDVKQDKFTPVQCWSKNEYSIIKDSEGNYWESGYVRCCYDSSTAKKIDFSKKIQSIHIGQNALFIITNDGKVQGKGECYDNLIPEGSDTSSWKTANFYPDDPKKKEFIVDASCSRIATTFVSKEGKLWLMGDTIKQLLEPALETGSTPKEIVLPDKMLAKRAWAVAALQDYDETCIYVELEHSETGEKGIYVAGKGEKLLGSGEGQSEIKKLTKIDFADGVVIDQLETFGSKIVAIDTEGQLWGWGQTKYHEFGFDENPDKGYLKPTKLTNVNALGFKAKKVGVYESHMLVMFEDKEGAEKLYAIGKKFDSTFSHLGYKSDAWPTTNPAIHELTDFGKRKILSFSGGRKSTMVILDGPGSTPSQGLYQHEIGGGAKSQGLLHFYKKGDKWEYVTADEYEMQKDQLPPLCLVIKCPLKNLETLKWPDLDALTKEMIDNDAKPEASGVKHTGITCHATQKEIVGARYYTRYTVNDQEVELNFSEAGMKNDNEYSLAPQVFFRLSKPLLAGKELPQLDPAEFYATKVGTKLSLEVEPNLTYMKNSALLKRTSEAWKEVDEVFNKFDKKHTKEVLEVLNEKLGSRIRDCSNPDDITFEDYFKVGDITFKNEELQKYSDKIKSQRAKLLWRLNCNICTALSYRISPLAKIPGTFTNLISAQQDLVLSAFKDKILKRAIDKLPTGSRGTVRIKRNPAKEFADAGKCDHTGEFTIFGQILQQTKKNETLFECFRQNGTDDQVFEVLLMGEGSQDVGGPYREMLSNVATEVQSLALPLMVKTPNNRNDHGSYRDCWTINTKSTYPTHQELFRLLGYFIGNAARSKSAMDYNFPPVFWKRLLGAKVEMNDLKEFDKFTFQLLEETKQNAAAYPAADFDAVMMETFTTVLSDQTVVELCEGGAERQVTHANHQEFIDLVIRTRLDEGQKQIDWIKEGISEIISLDIFSFLTWRDLELRVCGPKEVTTEALKAITDNADSSEDQSKFFWQMFEAFTQEERKSYLKFVWGRSKIPTDCSDLRYRHRLDISHHMNTDGFPIAHTCFFSVDVPRYETLEKMTEKFKYAIEMCGEIDGDYGEGAIRPENSDSE